MNSLERSQRERAYFNSIADQDTPFVPQDDFDYLGHPCIPEHQVLLKLFPDGFRGKRVLDLGCGVGEASVSFALRGAEVSAIDVSEKAVDVGKGLAGKCGVPVDFKTVQGNAIPFPDASFDLVYGNGVLHHLDLKASVPEIKRVLKPNGCGFFIEPKKGNPAISVYRLLARNQRSADESPLTKRDFKLVRRYFEHVVQLPSQVATLIVFFKLFFFEKQDPGHVSYSRQPILYPEKYQALYNWGIRRDHELQKWFPRLFKMLSWNYVVVVAQEFAQLKILQSSLQDS